MVDVRNPHNLDNHHRLATLRAGHGECFVRGEEVGSFVPPLLPCVSFLQHEHALADLASRLPSDEPLVNDFHLHSLSEERLRGVTWEIPSKQKIARHIFYVKTHRSCSGGGRQMKTYQIWARSASGRYIALPSAHPNAS